MSEIRETDADITKVFESLEGADDFVSRAAASGQTAIEAAMAAQRITPVYGESPEQPEHDTWAGQPNSAL